MDILQWVPLLGALGIGSVIGNWFGAGRARREVRSEVLRALAAAETKRWAGSAEYIEFVTALRELETAALVARVPRQAIRHYLVLVDVARHLSDDSFEARGGDEEMGAGGINGHFADVLRDAAEIVTRLAWRPWWSRMSLRQDLSRLRTRASQIAALDKGEDRIHWYLAGSQRTYGVLPRPLGDVDMLGIKPISETLGQPKHY
jgi:hypothetical protein